MSYENLVASPLAQDKTIVVSLDDGLNGQVYIYVGDKQATGTEIEKAGLSGGLFLRDQGRPESSTRPMARQ